MTKYVSTEEAIADLGITPRQFVAYARHQGIRQATKDRQTKTGRMVAEKVGWKPSDVKRLTKVIRQRQTVN